MKNTLQSEVSVSDVGKYFIWKSASENRPITNKKLQKLAYYAQAWYLVSQKGNKKLFPDKIEAWVHGPVVPSLYFQYKQFGFNPIDPMLGKNNVVKENFKKLLDEVWNVYGHLDGNSLETLAHNEIPWIEARQNLEKDELGNTEISDLAMYSYFSSIKNQSKPKDYEKQVHSL